MSTPVRPKPTLTAEETSSIQRMMDAVNLHYQARLAAANDQAPPQFVAIRLSDGSSNGELYDSRPDAVYATRNDPQTSFFVKVGIEPMPFREAALVFQMNRQAYARGVRFAEEAPVVPQLAELSAPLIPRTFRSLQ